MNFCTHCGTQLKPDAKFCSKCGQLVKTETIPAPVPTPAIPKCPKCGNQLAPGIKFCTSCGALVQVTAPGKQPAAGPSVSAPPPLSPQPVRPATPIQAQKPAASIPPTRKKGKKILVFAASTLVLLAAAGAALYFFGIYEPRESYADLSALYEEEKYDKAMIDGAASEVETIFLSADTTKLAAILSPTTLDRKREFFKDLQPHMAEFGTDFKSRKFLYATARFAVYEFSSAKGTFTVDFCLGEDGKWKLMRF